MSTTKTVFEKIPKDPIAYGKAFSADHFQSYFEKFPKAFANVYCGADCGKGWLKIVDPLIELCEKEGVEIHQIKEKFGGLRFYIDTAEKHVYDAIGAAEALSFKTCERCGADGKRRGGGWIKTLCDRCEDERKNRKDWNDGWWDDV